MINAPAVKNAFIPAVRQPVAVEEMPHGGFVVVALATPTAPARAIFATDDAESAGEFVADYYNGLHDAPEPDAFLINYDNLFAGKFAPLFPGLKIGFHVA